MTVAQVSAPGDLNLSWLHCNECHRSFEHHNRLSADAAAGEGLRVLRSDLAFAFTSCGHFFCDTCIQQHSKCNPTHSSGLMQSIAISSKFRCALCQDEMASVFKIDNCVPRALEMYLRVPLSQLEDSISVMTFQISNANSLIKSLRAKVSQQKELLSKAKQELASQKSLKEKLQELQRENESLRGKLEDVSRAAGGGSTPSSKPMASPTPAIHVPGRLSLRSPMRLSTQNISNHSQRPAPIFQPNLNQTVWNATPRSPAFSEVYIGDQQHQYAIQVKEFVLAPLFRETLCDWSAASHQGHYTPNNYYANPDGHSQSRLLGPTYNTLDIRGRGMIPNVPRTMPIPTVRTRSALPVSPRPAAPRINPRQAYHPSQ